MLCQFKLKLIMNLAPRQGLANITGTPVAVGPNSYNISYPCCKYSKKHYVPFLTYCERKALKTPCYTDALYDPPTLRPRIQYGTSLQYTAERVTLDIKADPVPNLEGSRKPYISRKKQKDYKKGNSGKVYLCRIEYKTGVSTPSIPNHRSYAGYDIHHDGQLVKIPPREHDTTLGPAFYQVPRDELNFNSRRYKGCKWSAMKGQRGKLCTSTYPGPDHYDVQFVKCIRHKDDKFRGLMRKCCNVPRYTCQLIFEMKGRPGPGDYETVDICKMGRTKNYCLGPKRTADRFPPAGDTGPGPTTYLVCDCYKHRQDFSLKKGIPFFGESLRFPIKKGEPRPGPSDYDRSGGKCTRYQGIRRSFNTTAERKLQAAPNGYPGPNEYDIPLEGLPCCSREPKVRSSVFSSMTCRFARPKKQDEPDSATYSTIKAFRYITDKHSHATGKRAAFNASERKFKKITDFAGLIKGFDTPGVGDYDLPPLHRSNANTMPYAERYPIVACGKHPGPQAYSLHTKVGDSMYKGKTSYNLRLTNQVKRRDSVQKLRPPKKSIIAKQISQSMMEAESCMFVGPRDIIT